MKKKCSISHCHRKATNGSYCEEHYKPKQNRRFEEHDLYRTARWTKVSKSIREEHPICQKCGEQLSAVVDHIVEIRWPNTEHLHFDESNLMALCHICHNNKTRGVAETLIQGKPNGRTFLFLSKQVVSIPQLETVKSYFQTKDEYELRDGVHPRNEPYSNQ